MMLWKKTFVTSDEHVQKDTAGKPVNPFFHFENILNPILRKPHWIYVS